MVFRQARGAGVGVMLAGREAGRSPHCVAFLLGSSAPDAGLPGGQGVGQAPGADRAPEADCLGGEDLRQRGAGLGDRKEKLGIFCVAGTP
jgi:hypothetical protein